MLLRILTSGREGESCRFESPRDDRFGPTSIAPCPSIERERSPPMKVYVLTAYLLFINDVVPEDVVLDAQSLPKVKHAHW